MLTLAQKQAHNTSQGCTWHDIDLPDVKNVEDWQHRLVKAGLLGTYRCVEVDSDGSKIHCFEVVEVVRYEVHNR